MKVISKFHDKYDLKKVYNVGDEFTSDDLERISDLKKRGLIEGDKKPSTNSFESKEVEKAPIKKAKTTKKK